MRASGASARGALGRWMIEVGSRKGEYLTADRNFIRCEGRRAERGGAGGGEQGAPLCGECEWGGGKARPKSREGCSACFKSKSIYERTKIFSIRAKIDGG